MRDVEADLKTLGRELDRIGGLELMQAVYYVVRRHPKLRQMDDASRILEIESVWDRIGRWQS